MEAKHTIYQNVSQFDVRKFGFLSVVGRTRSGKSINTRSFIMEFAACYEGECLIRIADGKNGSDYDYVASKLSDRSVAKPCNTSPYKTMYLDQMISEVFSEITQRRKNFEVCGVDNYEAYIAKLGRTMKPILFVVDEFGEWVHISEELKQEMNSLAVEAEKFGLKIVLISQRTEDLPSVFKDGLILAHRMKPRDIISSSYWETLANLEVGQYIIINKVPSGESFYRSQAWRTLRWKALEANIEEYGQLTCVLDKGTNGPFHVDHIKSRPHAPELSLELSNLMVVCECCNLSRGSSVDLGHKPTTNINVEEVAKFLLSNGKSTREIASVTGLSRMTVMKLRDKK